MMRIAKFIGLVAILALAITGGATAASTITGKNVRNNSLTGQDIKDRSLMARDFKSDELPAGPQGAPGPQGPQGSAGASGVAQIVAVSADDVGLAFAACPAGTRPVSGGGIEGGTGYLWANGAARDTSAGTVGWIVAGDPTSPVTAFAYCSAGVTRFTFPDGTVSAAATSTAPGGLTVARVKSLASKRAAE